MKDLRIAAVVAVLAGTALGLAGSASAEPLEGPYTATVTGGDVLAVGKKMPWAFTPCGPGCAQRILIGGEPSEFHLQGNTWTSTFGSVTETVDATTLSATTHQPDGTITWQLERP